MTQADTSHRGIAKAALGIEWENTESVARRVAEYAADLVQGIEAERDSLRIEAKGYADTIGIIQGLASEGLPIEIGGRRYVADAEAQAAIAAAMMGAVKPLKWDHDGRRLRMDGTMMFSKGYDWDAYETMRQEGYGLAHAYIIWPDTYGSKHWNVYGAFDGLYVQNCDGEMGAKAAAQADYQARILSALSIPADAMAALAERELLAEQRGFDRAKEQAAQIIKTAYPCETGNKWAAQIRAMEGSAA